MIRIVPHDEFSRVRAAHVDRNTKLALVTDLCRLNTLAAVKHAGSGHIGSSFSAMELVVWLYYERMNTLRVGLDDPNRDIYFSSKGHDVPGLYAVLHSVGIVPEERLLKLRRLGGLDGHPDVGIPGIECNSGSLGMGISKGKGLAWAKRLQGRGGHVYVLTGDGELQEGQNFEALQTTLQQGVSGLTVIVDHNKVQTDRPVAEIVDLGDLQRKFEAFGWSVARCDGHDFDAIDAALGELDRSSRPGILIADTIKGRGVSFMEHPVALEKGGGLYPWHAGAPNDQVFTTSFNELLDRANESAREMGLGQIALRAVSPAEPSSGLPQRREFVADSYGETLVTLAAIHPEIVVLDGDLAADCRVRRFEETYPERFLENGIAEQDMVSTAGGLARSGLLPVVNSFASFLAARANEQIYNNASEGTRIIYACHYAGMIPAGPGKSHQSIRDISLFAALPNVTILQPCNSHETSIALDYLVRSAPGVGVLRLAIGPSPRHIELPDGYEFLPGRGTILRDGDDAALFAYGPVMLHEALVAAELLERLGVSLRVVNMPWLSHVDTVWLGSVLAGVSRVFVLEDHAVVGGLGDRILAALAQADLLGGRQIRVFGVEGFPACGTPLEALKEHGLDGASIAMRIEAGTAIGTPVASAGVYTAEAPQ